MEFMKIILNLEETTEYMEKCLQEAATHMNEIIANRTGYGEDFDPVSNFVVIINFNIPSRILKDQEAMREQIYEALMLLQRSDYCNIYKSWGTLAIVLGRENVAAMSIDITPCMVFSEADSIGDFVSLSCEAIPGNTPYCTRFATAYIADATIYTKQSVASQVARNLASLIVQILRPRVSATYQ